MTFSDDFASACSTLMFAHIFSSQNSTFEAMLMSTRDIQRRRRASRFAIEVLAAITEDWDLFVSDHTTLDSASVHGKCSSRSSTVSTMTQFNEQPIVETSTTHGDRTQSRISLVNKYRWRMTHYYYLHLLMFVFNGLFGGLIIFFIERRNSSIDVTYLDAWFTAVSTICSCGLTTVDFAQLSRASQLVMMGFAFISGFAMSTLPALAIQAKIHRRTDRTNADHGHEQSDDAGMAHLPASMRAELARLPSPETLCYHAYLMCIVLILTLYFVIYSTGFLSIGLWLQSHPSPQYLLQNNVTLSPWYISGMLTLFSFNQNGLTPFSTSLARYIDDIFLNMVIVLVMSKSLDLCKSPISLFTFVSS